MPIYEYACSSCGRRIDVMHGISGQGPTTCEVCGGAMKKALTAPAIHFKGSGWAKKDARSSTAPAPAGAKKEDGASPASDGAGSTPGDSTPSTPAASPASATPAASGGTTSTPGA